MNDLSEQCCTPAVVACRVGETAFAGVGRTFRAASLEAASSAGACVGSTAVHSCWVASCSDTDGHPSACAMIVAFASSVIALEAFGVARACASVALEAPQPRK